MAARKNAPNKHSVYKGGCPPWIEIPNLCGKHSQTISVLQRRTKLPTLLENFDSPQMSPNCLERQVSIVATQALHLLNNAMVHDLAKAFARRVRRAVGEVGGAHEAAHGAEGRLDIEESSHAGLRRER